MATSSCILPPFIQPPASLTFTSLQSKFSGLHLQYFPKLYNHRITCRYGGGSKSRLQDSRQSKQTNSDDDQALDVSSIRSNTVRLIDDEQNMVGIVSKTAAIQMAEDAQLDLVILSPDADPPVVKLMDYNKYRYEQQKKKREQLKKSAALRMDQKELKMGYNIDVHDYSVRLRAAQKFLKDEHEPNTNTNRTEPNTNTNTNRTIFLTIVKKIDTRTEHEHVKAINEHEDLTWFGLN